MELNYLNDFVTLAKIRHFQEAADALFISQSTLSKHIKAIETELGQDLFIRSRKRSELSEFGKQFLPYAKKILDIQQEYTVLLLPHTYVDEHVSFGCIPMVTLYNFMQFFTLFKRSPSYQYNIVQGSTQRLLKLLKQKQVEFILSEDIPDLPEEEYEKLLYAKDRMVAILPQSHKLSSKKYITVEDLEDENLIAFSSSLNAEEPLQKQYPNAKFRIPISVEKEALLFELVQHGFGISVMTYWSSQKVTGDGIVVKEIYPQSNLEFYMIYQKNRNLSALTRSFSDFLKARQDADHSESQ